MPADTPITIRRMSFDALLDALADGAEVVTANARLSRSLRLGYERRMLQGERAAWPTPRVMPLDSWLIDRYHEAGLRSDDRLPGVLTADQEEQWWAGIIRSDGTVLRVDATARRARESWRRAQHWRLDPGHPAFAANENSAAFADWARRFARLCAERGQLSESELPDRVAQLAHSGALRTPARLMLAGFFELEPALQRCLEAVSKAGCEIVLAEMEGAAGRARRWTARDPRHEVGAVAAWAAGLLERDPSLRIAIVVPDLGERREAIAGALMRRLQPGALASAAVREPHPWNFSLGPPLSAQPVVATALGLLALARAPLDAAGVGSLLASPHWALPEDATERRAERARRALLDSRLRARGDASIRLVDLRFEARSADADGNPRPGYSSSVAQTAQDLLDALGDLPGRADAAAWAEAFSAWLGRAGWPRGRPLDSAEFQSVEAWNGLLSRLSSLGDFAGALTRDEALALLTRLADETPFQPRSGEASVQVLGLYEAIGQRFDHLWVMGLHDGAWPPPPRPDPYLPLAVQSARAMPLCDPERSRDWAVRMTAELVASAPDTVFSHAARNGAETLLVSPLIAGFELLAEAEYQGADADPWWRSIAKSAIPEPLPSPPALPLRTPRARGGSRLFRDQAACPFRAFAEHRLGARPLDRLQVGLGPARRGSLMHDVLDRLWRELGSQAELLSLDVTALRERVRTNIAEAIEAERPRSAVTLADRYAELEAGRLEEKILAWLELERQRAPFRVAAVEDWEEFDIGGIGVHLKLDRVDELESGGRVVLDYKTGKVSTGDWFGERPGDPQLPLYAVAAGARGGDAPVAAVAFAQIRPDEQGFRGVVREDGLLPGLPARKSPLLSEATERWPAVLAEWSQVLEGLAAAFRSGVADVDPRDGLKTCEKTHCELAALCRVRERLPGPGDDDAGSADDD